MIGLASAGKSNGFWMVISLGILGVWSLRGWGCARCCVRWMILCSLVRISVRFALVSGIGFFTVEFTMELMVEGIFLLPYRLLDTD